MAATILQWQEDKNCLRFEVQFTADGDFVEVPLIGNWNIIGAHAKRSGASAFTVTYTVTLGAVGYSLISIGTTTEAASFQSGPTATGGQLLQAARRLRITGTTLNGQTITTSGTASKSGD